MLTAVHEHHDAFGRPIAHGRATPRTPGYAARPAPIDTDDARTAALRSALGFAVGGWTTERVANLAGVSARRAGDWLRGAREFPARLVLLLPAEEQAAYFAALGARQARAA